jgi:hypothetical protein
VRQGRCGRQAPPHLRASDDRRGPTSPSNGPSCGGYPSSHSTSVSNRRTASTRSRASASASAATRCRFVSPGGRCASCSAPRRSSSSRAKLVASHERAVGKGREILDLDHYLEVFRLEAGRTPRLDGAPPGAIVRAVHEAPRRLLRRGPKSPRRGDRSGGADRRVAQALRPAGSEPQAIRPTTERNEVTTTTMSSDWPSPPSGRRRGSCARRSSGVRPNRSRTAPLLPRLPG